MTKTVRGVVVQHVKQRQVPEGWRQVGGNIVKVKRNRKGVATSVEIRQWEKADG